nr:putative reverse transcriptase domain-containing protein [Tanacetum cinerariifolium]
MQGIRLGIMILLGIGLFRMLFRILGGIGHYARNCTARPRRRDDAYLQTQLLIAQKEEAGIQLQAEEYDQMAAAADLDDIEEVNANCILMANLQQASTSGTQSDSTPVYDTDGSTEVHKNYDNNEIFNMFTQEERYTELLKPIPESHQVSQNDNEVISKDTGVEQGGETVEQHPANFEETPVLLDGLHFDDKLHFVEEPVEIVDREVKRLKRSRIPLVKVRWNSKQGHEFMWEREDQFWKKYPHLFARTASSSSVAS